MTEKARQGQFEYAKEAPPSVAGQSLQAGLQAAAIGGAISAISSGFGNLAAYNNGSIRGEEALKNVEVDVASSAFESGAKAAAGTAIKAAAATAIQQGSKSALMGSLARGNAAMAAASVGVDTLKGLIDLSLGKIDGAEFAKGVGRSTASAGGGWGGMSGGAALGTAICPGIGTVIGGVIGGIGGSLGASSVFSWLFD